MNDEIKFTEGEKKVTPELMNAEISEMQRKAIKGIEQKQITEQEKIKAGIVSPPSAAEGVPKELPFLFFYYGSKIIKCEQFQTSDEENKILAHHLSIIFGSLIKNVWVWSVIAIFIILLGKIVVCWKAVSGIFRRKKGEEKQTEEMKEQGRPPANVMGDGT